MPAADETIWDRARLARPHDQPDKARRVREMFDRIAPTYERVNRVLSAGRDGYWRRRAVASAGVERADRVLDVACGTGDFARAFAGARPRAVVGADFAEGMLALAAGRRDSAIAWIRADALALPFADGSFTVVSCAFGVRNFHDPAAGLAEMHRVLRPGGRAVLLEFTLPRTGLSARLYACYFHRLLPRAARVLSQDRSGAYDYLPKSVASFLDTPGMVAALASAGFDRIEHRPLTLGIVTLYLAGKR